MSRTNWPVLIALAAAIMLPIQSRGDALQAGTNITREQQGKSQTFAVILRDEAPYFNPKRLRIARGSTVVWENRGPALVHTIAVSTAKGMTRSGSIRPGQTWSFTFNETDDAVVKTSCEVHPYMYGIVIVGNPPDYLISVAESTLGSNNGGNATARILEFSLPVPNSVPGILAIDADDNVWFTMGGGGFANIDYPPLNKIGRLTLDGDITVYSLPTEGCGPSGIIIGLNGIVYVTELFGNKIARLDPHRHIVEEFPIPTLEAWPTGLGLDAEGNLWFNETKGNKIGRLTRSGNITEFNVPTTASRSTGMVVDRTGNVWIAEREANKIGCLRPDGTFIEYSIPTPRAKPTGITLDERGRVWFAEREGNKIGVLEDGQIREFALPTANAAPFFPLADRNGQIWFSEMFGNRIRMLNPENREFIEYAIPTKDSWPLGLAVDSQGNLWFAEQLGNKIGVLLRNPEKSAGASARVKMEH